MDPTIGVILGGLLNFLGGATAPAPYQQRQSFTGTAADPRTVLPQALSAIETIGNALTQGAAKGTQLNVHAPAVPGLSVQDPTLKDPSLEFYASPLASLLGGLTGSGGGNNGSNGPTPFTGNKGGLGDAPQTNLNGVNAGEQLNGFQKMLQGSGNGSQQGGVTGLAGVTKPTDSTPLASEDPNSIDNLMNFIHDPLSAILTKLHSTPSTPFGGQ